MFLLTVLFISGLKAAHGYQCEDLSGVWVNELNSTMTIVNLPFNKITGQYRTAVESNPGAAAFTSNLTGAFLPFEDGSLLSFTVLYNNGSSLTSWVGQCLVCDGQEIIFTTWVLQRAVRNPTEQWMDTLVRQNTFTRKNSGSGSQPGSQISSVTVESSVSSPAMEGIVKGAWISGIGDILNVTNTYGNRTAGGFYNNFEMIGQFDGKENFTAFGFVSPISAQKFKGGVGHIYPNDANRLGVSWLEHEFTKDCVRPRSRVFVGMDYYIRSNS
ncbi:uncharacterized protein LOC118196794 isoform X1 [Stegodyphus dumicola]|uniref:uncharacterized protein LOC118196794 isoform X1 n=2 Tax=Stegodyphus dumicola TaxID=202533 RepID=UPI0015AB399F|nr:uncharacterized protein LOC118196794 isoform X1 [Stegodyphus dumicola]